MVSLRCIFNKSFRCSSMAERVPVKDKVVGSNPTTGANFRRLVQEAIFWLCLIF